MFEDIWLSHKDDTFQWDQNSFVVTISEIPSFKWIFVGKLDLNHCQLLYFSYKRQISTVMTSLDIFYNAFSELHCRTEKKHFIHTAYKVIKWFSFTLKISKSQQILWKKNKFCEKNPVCNICWKPSRKPYLNLLWFWNFQRNPKTFDELWNLNSFCEHGIR